MTDVTTVGEIVVKGQRRVREGDPFPSRPVYETYQPDVSGIDPVPEEEQPPDPCADPETALDWNADAIAALALKLFRQKAEELGDDGLYTREFGAQIYQRADGSLYLGPVAHGDPQTGTFTMDETGATSDNLVGEIHTHPSPQMEPSVADWGRLNHWSAWTGRNFRSYIVSRNPNEPASDFAIRVYDTTSDQSSDVPGPEVNPEGQPCP